MFEAELLVIHFWKKRGSSESHVNSRLAVTHPTSKEAGILPARGDKNALDGFCHSAASMVVGLGISHCRKLDSPDPGDSFDCVGN